ncbi:MAG: prepilin-type N-terminal cleavage/methylation domain-containing protein, partial [Akkermansiaceae bacterium]
MNQSKKLISPKGFTLMETVIAIGVLAVLLTGFLAVFTPATQGIRRSINSQQADRLTSTLERELVTVREGQTPSGITTGFEKAFDWIQKSNGANNAIFVYQYRGDLTSLRSDDTPTPMSNIEGQPGLDYTIQSIARRADDPFLEADIDAIEGSIFFVKPTQLVYENNSMVLNEDPGTIKHL